MGIRDWFIKKGDEAEKKIESGFENLKKEYRELSDRAEAARFEDALASAYNENEFVSAVLSKKILFTKSEKRIRSFWNNYEKSEWTSGFGCFVFSVHHTSRGHLMEFRINHSPDKTSDLFRIGNVIMHGADRNDAAEGYGLY